MAKPSARSTLYRIIEAGQLAHRALLVPLRERGLEPGDDAVLFSLARGGMSDIELAQAVGIDEAAASARFERLIGRDLLARQAVGPDLAPGLALTERGERMRLFLEAHWFQLEAALIDELPAKRQRHLNQMLKRFIELLQL